MHSRLAIAELAMQLQRSAKSQITGETFVFRSCIKDVTDDNNELQLASNIAWLLCSVTQCEMIFIAYRRAFL